MKKIVIIGNFFGEKESYNGQTVKTKTLYKSFIEKYGKNYILKIDTYYFTKRPIKFWNQFIKGMINSNKVVILPAQRSVKILIPLIQMFNNKEIHYVMIGGWLPKLLENNFRLINKIKKVKYIYSETYKVKKQLEKLGFSNVVYMRNAKDLSPIKLENKTINSKEFKTCIFSRIEKEKGITDAINIVNKINNDNNDISIKLDIYGQINKNYEKEFKNLINDSKNFVNYLGVRKPFESVNILHNYDLLLFPTRYFTEGIPGTIIDAYFAGVPVLSSRWESFEEIVIENRTGISYEFDNMKDFEKKLTSIIEKKNELILMKKNCIEESKKYLPINAFSCIFNNIDK